jgi:putative peptidoglycan lipid II flippase
MNTKLSKSIASVSAALAILTIVSKGFGLLREMIYAKNFGLSLEFDLFLVGSIIPVTINTALLYLGQHYFVPEFNCKRSISEEEGEEFFNNSLHLFLTGAIIISILLYIYSSSITELFISKYSEENFKIAQNIFLLFLLTLPLNAGISIISAYQQSKFNFTYPAVVQILMNLVIIVLVFSLTELYQIYILPVSFIASYLFGFVVLYIKVNKKIRFKIFSFHRLNLNSNQTKNLLSLIIIEGLSLSYILIDRYYFEFLDEGGISSLNYAITLFVLPISIISVSLSTVIFPKFSQTVTKLDDDLVTNFRKAVFISIYLMVPITIIFLYMGKDFVKIFYERGKY